MIREIALPLLFFAIAHAVAQDATEQFQRGARIAHAGGMATVLAKDPRPLLQALIAVREEHGWVVDYEEPAYRGSEVVDWTNGRKRVAGGEFTSTYLDAESVGGPADPVTTLSKIITDFNSSSNPGRFTLRDEGYGRYSVIGLSRQSPASVPESLTPILDTRITLAVEKRTLEATVGAILDEVHRRTGVNFVRAGIANNVLAQSVIVGGDMVAARSLLAQAFQNIRPTQIWTLTFDPDINSYGIGITTAMKVSYEATGKRIVTPAQPARASGQSHP